MISQIIPIKKLKDAAKVSEICRKEYIYRELEISEQEIKAGKTRDTRKALADVREKYGL